MSNVITLLGYMGSGKTTYGKLLAERLGLDFIDLDDFIVEKSGMEIAEIFKIKGENWFRKIETKYLEELIKRDNLILSLGGGTPMQNGNMNLINDFTESVYLKASVNTLYKYLKYNRSKRPIIKNLSDSELKEFISKHLDERLPFYSKAKLSVVTDSKSIEEVVEALSWIVK